MIMIAGNIAVAVVLNVTGGVAEAIPNRLAPTGLVPGPFNLIG
jgi:hypothetical protein